MKKWKVTYYIGIAVVILCLIGIGIYMALAQRSKASLDKTIQDALIDPVEETYETIPYPEPTYETIVTDPESGEDIVEIVDPGLICPVDFFTLWNTNSDIYAWLRIPGTNIDYPVLQHSGDTFSDSDYYLRKDLDGNYSTAGNLFSQYLYNSDFDSDKITVIYGHNMRDNTMFGTIDEYVDSTDYIDSHSMIYIYTPYKAYRYKVIGVLIRGGDNLMYSYSGLVEGKGDNTDFVKDLNNGEIGRGWMEDGFEANDDDNFLILSTCTNPNTGRILVIAVREAVK